MKKYNLDTFNLFLFDMDGTLVNTEPLHARAMDKVLKKNQLNHQIGDDESMEHFMGMTDTSVLKELCPELSDSEIDRLIAEKNQILCEILLELDTHSKEQLTAPGLLDLLAYIKSHHKNLAVVSASENAIVHATLKAFNLLHHFDFWFGRGSTSKTKPHPDPYIEAMKKAGFKESETVIFEDSPTGLMAAKGSGASIIEVAPFSSMHYLKDYRFILDN